MTHLYEEMADNERSDHPFTQRSGDMVSMPWKERSIVEERMRFVLRLRMARVWPLVPRVRHLPGYRI